MADADRFTVSPEQLQPLVKAMVVCDDSLAQAVNGAQSFPSWAFGDNACEEQFEQFLKDWKWGTDRLSEELVTAWTVLHRAAKNYDALDAGLTQAQQQAGARGVA